jgi:hypothetical protein
VDVPDPDAARFDLWALPGRKRLIHDGRNLALTRQGAGPAERATLGRGLEQGQPFARTAWGRSALGRGSASAPRIALAHIRALLALDAKTAGASDLQIARALMSPGRLEGAWSSDSAERALVRDALTRGRAFRDGRWRELVWGPGRRPAGA